MEYFIDAAYKSLIKYGEELCGDNVSIIRMEDSTIVVLADGLGSGVKANILSTLTSKIASTLLKGDADIYETVDTIINTLPVCKERNLAYSTFTIVKIMNNGNTYIAEYDSPPFVLIRNGESLKIDKKKLIIKDKIVYESMFNLLENDIITFFSDGVIHAGIGEVLNLGWSYENVEHYLLKCSRLEKCSQEICNNLLDVCWNLYNGKAGDDTTVVSIKYMKPKYVDLFTGPSVDKSKDSYVIKEFIKRESTKIICGGTAANIASRELGKELMESALSSDCDVPPIAVMEGINLITEGVLTLKRTIDILKKYTATLPDYNFSYNHYLDGKDGASLLAKLLLENCTDITIWHGSAINPAHEDVNFPVTLDIKQALVNELCDILRYLGKNVSINYI